MASSKCVRRLVAQHATYLIACAEQDESEDSGQDIPFDQKDGANDEDAAEDGEQGGEEEWVPSTILDVDATNMQ